MRLKKAQAKTKRCRQTVKRGTAAMHSMRNIVHFIYVKASRNLFKLVPQIKNPKLVHDKKCSDVLTSAVLLHWLSEFSFNQT